MSVAANGAKGAEKITLRGIPLDVLSAEEAGKRHEIAREAYVAATTIIFARDIPKCVTKMH